VADDAFDFYPCMVDQAPASIYVNLRFEHDPTPAGADTRCTLAIALRAPGELGIGTAEETEAIDAFEERVLAAAAERGLVFAGRLRHRGVWELTFYGPAGARTALDRFHDVDGRRVTTTSEPDPTWSYYRELLLPDAERQQWMDDRRLVQILREQGDSLVAPRRIDHRVRFTTEAARDAFVADVARQGFQHEPDAEPGVARVWRVDPIELDHVHEVVMLLVDAAQAGGGVYAGWTASIER
jgi:hypothetical protein